MVLTQGFHSFTSYLIKQKSKSHFNVIFAFAFSSLTSRYKD